MSCSHSINTYTNAKFIYRGVTRFKQSYSCGKCAGCISKQRTDWRVRSYYESLDCLSKPGSFILFDTLTYSDENLKRYSNIFPELDIPKLMDKYAFSRDDLKRFMKRLRINIHRLGYSWSSEQLRYIITSEYGTSEFTRGRANTHRPHYHCLFFVTFDIDPIVFSREVARAWFLGKTDGVKPYDDCKKCPVNRYCKGKCIYHSEDYVRNERLVSSNSQANIIKCVNYVTKYISKDMYLTKGLQADVDAFWQYFAPSYCTDYQLYKQYRRFCSQVLPFHLQSQGFGLAVLHDLGKRIGEYDFLLKTNKIHLPTADASVVRLVHLPRYYTRKLYYDYEKVDGAVRWFRTEEGVQAKIAHLDDEIEDFIREFYSFKPDFPKQRLRDLAIYKFVYKDTLSDWQSLYLPYKQYLAKMLRFHHRDEPFLYVNRNTVRDKLTIGKFIASSYVVRKDDGEVIFKGVQRHGHFLPFDGYVVVDDKICVFWHGFDSLLLEYDKWRKDIAISNDAMMFKRDVNVDYYKRLGLLPSD